MRVAITGPLGSGKTAMGVFFAEMSHSMMNLPIHTNVPSYHTAQFINSLSTLKNITGAVLLFDEAYTNLDSRKSRDNTDLTSWVYQGRKDDNLLFYCTPNFFDVDIRLRRVTDYLLLCEKKQDELGKKYHKITFVDLYTKRIGKTMTIYQSDLMPIFALYDTKSHVGQLK